MDIAENTNKQIWWQCSKNLKHIWKQKPNNRKYNGCPYCAGQLPSEDYNLLIDNPKLCEEWDYEKNKRKPNEYTPKTNKKVWWKCRECGNKWETSISSRNGVYKTGCPNCNKSKGERKIKEILDTKNIIYKREYIFDNLTSDLGNPLRFDFAIFIKNKLYLLIEYDGEFHYKKYYKEQNFEILQIHDQRKDNYCKFNNIPLLRIPYWEFDNIENILFQYLKQED